MLELRVDPDATVNLGARSRGRELGQVPVDQAHADGRDAGHARLHGARAVRGRADRRAHRPVQLLRRALRGALRQAPVRRRDVRRAHDQRDDRRRDSRAREVARPGWLRKVVLRGLAVDPRSTLPVDERAARGAPGGSDGAQAAHRGRSRPGGVPRSGCSGGAPDHRQTGAPLSRRRGTLGRRLGIRWRPVAAQGRRAPGLRCKRQVGRCASVQHRVAVTRRVRRQVAGDVRRRLRGDPRARGAVERGPRSAHGLPSRAPHERERAEPAVLARRRDGRRKRRFGRRLVASPRKVRRRHVSQGHRQAARKRGVAQAGRGPSQGDGGAGRVAAGGALREGRAPRSRLCSLVFGRQPTGRCWPRCSTRWACSPTSAPSCRLG